MSRAPRQASLALLSLWLVASGAVAASRARAQEAHRLPGPPGAERSLPELLAFAEEHAPPVRVAVERRGLAEAARRDANLRLVENPSVDFGIGPRRDGAGEIDFDWYLALGQPFEIAGERRLRREAAAEQGARLEAEEAATRWAVRREVILAFRAAAVARARLDVAERLRQLAGEVVTISERRLAAGDVTAIDRRLAEVDRAQAEQAALEAAEELWIARILLAEVTGWETEAPPNVAPGLEPPRPVPPLAALLETAADHHPELQARRAAVAEAHARASLADRGPWPTPTLGVQFAREGSAGSPANYILLGTLGTTLPFWQRNQGERAERRADEEVARAEAEGAALALEARIARAHAALTSASERLSIHVTTVAPMLDECLALLQRGFDAGELPLSTFAETRARLLTAEGEGLDAYADYLTALAELEFAVGAELASASAATTDGGAR